MPSGSEPSARGRAQRPAGPTNVMSRRLRFRTRLIKSYKYKYKRAQAGQKEDGRPRCGDQNLDGSRLTANKTMTTCDIFDPSDASARLPARQEENTKRLRNNKSKQGCCSNHLPIISLICHLLLGLGIAASIAIQPSRAFCPLKCLCDDAQLSANCTRVASISIVPMTLNPLLKTLTLNELPISDLSNSLSLYRQLEYLNLNANKLAQIRYQNFNFKPAPARAISLNAGGASHLHLHSTISNNRTGGELLARHLKMTLERELTVSGGGGSSDGGDDEIRRHLRELHLADNRLEQLGAPLASDHQQQQQHSMHADFYGAPEVHDNAAAGLRRTLRVHELERLAPFLTLTKLEVLDLSGNKLARLQAHCFLGLLELTHLSLARNQLESIDRHAFVGLLSLAQLDLSANKLAHHQAQLNQLGRLLCWGPLVELAALSLADNSAQVAQHHHLVLPSDTFACAPQLRELSLRNLRLKYVQANALDHLAHLQRLDLSENLFERVPLVTQAVSNNYEGEHDKSQQRQLSQVNHSPLALSLRELNLSRTLIEFVNANSFGALEKLERLELSHMPQLVSFDAASLVTPASTPTQQLQRQVNQNLRELHVSHNKHLQSFHSSLGEPILFERLRWLNLRGSGGLRELQLDRILTLDSVAQPGDFQGAENNGHDPLQLDISQAHNLNCSTCHMGWLVAAAKQQARNYRATNFLAPPAQEAQIAPPQWTPIPFDAYGNPQQQQQQQFASFSPAIQQPLGVPSGTAHAHSRLHLLNLDGVSCAWPFSMPLVELIALETTYAPLFDFSACSLQVSATAQLRQGSNHLLAQTTSKRVAGALEVEAGRAQSYNNSESRTIVTGGDGPSRPNHVIRQREGAALTEATPLWASSILVALIVCTVIALIKLVHAISARQRARATTSSGGGPFKFSPSFTVTTSLGDSPTTSSSSSSRDSAASALAGQKRQLFVRQVGGAQCRPTLITSSAALPDHEGAAAAAHAPANWWHLKHQQQQQQLLLAQAQMGASGGGGGGQLFAPGGTLCGPSGSGRPANWAPAGGSCARNNERASPWRVGRLREKFQKSLPAWRARARGAPARPVQPSDEITFWPAQFGGGGGATAATTTRAGSAIAPTWAPGNSGARATTTRTTRTTRTRGGPKMAAAPSGPVFLSGGGGCGGAEDAEFQRGQIISGEPRYILHDNKRQSSRRTELAQSNLFSRFVGRLSGRAGPTSSPPPLKSAQPRHEWAAASAPAGNRFGARGEAPQCSPPLPPLEQPPPRLGATGRQVHYQVALGGLAGEQQQRAAIYGNLYAAGNLIVGAGSPNNSNYNAHEDALANQRPPVNHYSVCDESDAQNEQQQQQDVLYGRGFGDESTHRPSGAQSGRQQLVASYAQRPQPDQVVASHGVGVNQRLRPCDANNEESALA